MENLVIFDKGSRTWRKNAQARIYMDKLKDTLGTNPDPHVSHDDGAGGSMSPGAAAGISIGATLACVVIATLVITAVRARRQKRKASYRRLENPLLDGSGGYGAVGGNNAVVSVDVDDRQ
nr:hypothetical protein BaRGS_034831 [Batillaria attramentaria]